MEVEHVKEVLVGIELRGEWKGVVGGGGEERRRKEWVRRKSNNPITSGGGQINLFPIIQNPKNSTANKYAKGGTCILYIYIYLFIYTNSS